jgi:hypothetical protein
MNSSHCAANEPLSAASCLVRPGGVGLVSAVSYSVTAVGQEGAGLVCAGKVPLRTRSQLHPVHHTNNGAAGLPVPVPIRARGGQLSKRPNGAGCKTCQYCYRFAHLLAFLLGRSSSRGGGGGVELQLGRHPCFCYASCFSSNVLITTGH